MEHLELHGESLSSELSPVRQHCVLELRPTAAYYY
jgi:hypothetical protein